MGSMNFMFYNNSLNSTSSHPITKYDSASCLLGCEIGHGKGSNNSHQLLTPNQVQLRFLNPNDCNTVKQLCAEWFPIEYPPTWYEAITSDPNFYSLAAVLDGEIIGLIVSELRAGRSLGSEDRDLLAKSQLKKFNVAYILSLGVVNTHRRNGIASLLLSSLLNHLSNLNCKAVYLHVLSSNESAIRFYEKHQFRVHKFLPYYYCIGGRGLDGFTYVLYLNCGHPPWGLHQYVFYVWDMIFKTLFSLPNWCVVRIRRIAHSVITFAR